MVKTKVPSWEGKKKMFKDGDPDVFRGFNFQTWKNMTDGERAMWTEFSEVARAPIPKEVIDFKKKTEIPKDFEDEEVEVSVDELEAVKVELVERGIKFSYNSKLETLKKKLADADNTE